MKTKFLIILLSAVSLTAFAQDKKTISVLQPECDNAVVANMIKIMLTNAFAHSEEWQLVERPSEENMNRRMLAGEPIGNLHPAQYILTTGIQDVFGKLSISCKITETETALMIGSAREMCETSPQSIQQACSSIAKQLLEKQ